MNRLKLLGKIAESGHTQKSLAEVIGMSENTLTSRINGKSPFRVDEIISICSALNITDDSEKASIFLGNSSHI